MKLTDLKRKSIEIIKSNQHAAGSYVACPNFDTYKYCWLRDGSFIAYAMDVAGEYDSAERFYEWVNSVILAQAEKVEQIIGKAGRGEMLEKCDYLPTRYTLKGHEVKDEWPNFQLDGYGTWLWALCGHIRLTGREHLITKYQNSIQITLDYLKSFWHVPNYDCWEENGDKIHTSTLACLYGGFNAITSYIQDASVMKAAADVKAYILKNCVKDGRLTKFVGIDDVDASLIWVSVPFSVLDIRDPIVVSTIAEIERKLLHGGGVHRYSTDTYYGGGEWLLLSCWLGWYYAEADYPDKASDILKWVEEQANEKDEMPEQVLEHVNNADYIGKWRKQWGDVATPLLWSHAMYLILFNDIHIH